MSLALHVRSRLLSLTVAFGLVSLAAAQSTTQPNLLLIIPDDLGIDSVGCYSPGSAPPTPNIDAMAQGGLRFTHCFVNPACSPTRAAILTGRYAFRTECTGALNPGAIGLSANALTMAMPLNAAGYQTAMIGKWHLGNRYGPVTPGAYGWNHFEGVLDSGVGNPYQWPKTTNGLASTCTQYILTDQVDSAINWIQTRTGPWALALTLTLPHVPFHTPPANLHSQNLAGLSPQTTPRPFFVAMVEAMDRELGRLFTTLGPSVLDNTNIVLIGDNGTDGAVVAPPLSSTRSKGSLYEGGCRVPLIIKGPAVGTPGSTATEMVNAIDVFPTALGFCGVPFPAPPVAPYASPLDGSSFAPALTGQSGYGRSHIYTEITNSPLGDGYSIRSSTHRLIRYMQNQPQHQEFYDLVNDPLEQTNLLAGTMSPADQAAFQSLMAELETIRSDGWGELYGSGCGGGASGVPFLRWQSQPRIGTTFVAYVGNLSQTCTDLLGFIGFSRTTTLGQALPIDLSVIGMTNCPLNVSLDWVVPFFIQTGYGVYVTIPAIPSLYQTEFYLQTLAYDAPANPAGLLMTRGLRCVIGQ